MSLSRKRVPGTNPGASKPGGSPQSKKRKSVRTELMPDTIEWPPADRLWAVIGDSASENYLKTQPSLDDYALASKRFHARLYMVVRGLSRDQVQVVFRATVPNWYCKADKGDQLRVSELFETAHTWVESHLIDKLSAYSQLWYKSGAGEKYYKDWHHAK